MLALCYAVADDCRCLIITTLMAPLFVQQIVRVLSALTQTERPVFICLEVCQSMVRGVYYILPASMGQLKFLED